MKILVIVLIIVGLGILIIKSKKSNKHNLKELVKRTFPKYTIIEKFGTVMICEINHRNEPDELVFIRIKPNRKKKINRNGRRLDAEYPAIPTIKELKNDFSNHLN